MNSNKDPKKRNDTNFDRVASLMFFLLRENCHYPFGPLFRLLNVFAGKYFLVYCLLTPFSCACLMLIYRCKNRSPVRVLVHFATLIITTDFDFSHLAQLLADLNSDGVQKLLAFIGTILLVRYFLDSTTIHDLCFISPYIFNKNALCWQKKRSKMLKFENSKLNDLSSLSWCNLYLM